MKSVAISLSAALALAAMHSAGAQDTLYLAAGDTEALIAKEGQKVVVYGQTLASAKSESGTNFVHFEKAVFYLVTFKSDLGRFPDGEPADLYERKRLAVEGVLSIHLGKPQIKLTDPAQITVLAADAIFPPPSGKKAAPADSGKAMTNAPAPAPENPAPAEPAVRKPPVDPAEYFKKADKKE